MEYSDDKHLVNVSWLELKPNEESGGNIEDFASYYARMKRKYLYKHIPSEVYEQWIWSLHNNCETRQNYGWINYRYVTFDLVELEGTIINNLNVIPDYKSYVQDLS